MNLNEDGNGKGNGQTPVSTSTSSTSRKISRGRNHIKDDKIEGGGNSRKKMKRGESSNSGAGQSQKSEVEQTSMNNFSPENVSANADEEPSTSSSYFLWNRSRQEAPYPEYGVLDLSIKMKMNTDDSSNSQDEDEAADEDEGLINDLPPEMLTKILKCVDTATLFKCRRVSRRWLEISSQILTGRTDAVFTFDHCALDWIPAHSGPLKMSTKLQKFVKCMKKCRNIPYAHFSFDFGPPSFFDTRDWLEFLSIFAPSKNPNPKPNPNQKQQTKIKCLHLKCDRIPDKKSLQLFTEKLRDLLLSKIPRLEELGLDFSVSFTESNYVKLFPLPENTESESTTTNSSTVSASASVPVQLPYLKVLEIEADMFPIFAAMIQDLLKAAVNLTEIRVERPCCVDGDYTSLVFQALHSLGKLHLLKKVETDLDENFLSDVKRCTQDQKSNFLLGFKVRELELNLFYSYVDTTFYADATNFISNLLESSKDTLETLKMSPLGFLDGLQFPKFTNLRTLKMYQFKYFWNQLQEPLFPPGIKSTSTSRDIFATVEYLNVKTPDWEIAFPQEDSIPIFPSVHTLCFEDEELQAKDVAKLSFMCPNLKHLVIQKSEENSEEFDFFQVGREIWTHLKQLESLEVDLDVNLEAHDFPALDSCFTGISVENCQRLYELMKAEKRRNESESQAKLPESEEIMKLTQREHPSILDMTNLKTLTINPQSGKTIKRKHFFTPKITWISKKYAFKLMPQLQFNRKRHSNFLSHD